MSIGDAEKLKTFLDQNPNVPRNNFFVDGYSLDAYGAVGFNKQFTKSSPQEVLKASPPNLSPGQWMSYLGNAPKVQPPLQYPEGILRLGGTMVVNGNDIIYQWNDLMMGDHPDIEYVSAIARETARKNGAPTSM